MSEEKFFSQVKSSLEFYSPEAPEAVYSGMRRKLWWSGFTKLSATRFNMWYLILLVGLGSGALAYSNTCTAPATECKVSPLTPSVKPTEEAKVIPAVTEPVVVAEPEVVSQPAVVTAPAQTAVVAPSTPRASRPKSTQTTSVVKPMDVPSSEPKTASSEPTIVNTDAPVNPSTTEAQTTEQVKEEPAKKKRKTWNLPVYSQPKDSSEEEK